jgi:peptidoglycan/LPS O-acetylase OafA/YrhL
MPLLKSHKYINLKNNFDLLRFLLSMTVFLVHLSALAPFPYYDFTTHLNSALAVKSFFVISGLLIFKSYENTSSIKKYFAKRFFRIYPAYIVVMVACLFASLFSCLYSGIDNIRFKDYFEYFFSNLIFLNFLHPNLPGLFTENLITSVNGALWTLKIEIIFYASVPIIVLIAKKNGYFLTLFTLFCISILYRVIIINLNIPLAHHLLNQFPSQLVFFLAGAMGFYFFNFFKKYSYFFLGLTTTFFLIPNTGWIYFLLEPLFLCVLIVYFALLMPYLGNFAKYGDFSYGIYIIHFPLIQFFVQIGLFNKSPLLAFFLTIFLVLGTSFFLWHFVEKPFLKK